MRRILAHSWLGRVYKADKWLFVLLSLFFFFTLFANFIRLQATPFFIWAMYSQKLPEKTDYSYLEVHYNGNKLLNIQHSWNEPAKNYLYLPLGYYIEIKDSNYVDPFRNYLESHWLKKHPAFTGIAPYLYPDRRTIDKFPGWYKRYLSLQVNEPVNNILVLKRHVQFHPDGASQVIATDSLLYIP